MDNRPVATVEEVLKAAAQARDQGRDFIAVLTAGKNGPQWIGVPVSH